MKCVLSGFVSVILIALFSDLLGALPSQDSALTAIEGHLTVTQPYNIRITTDSGMLGGDYQFEDQQNGIDNAVRKQALRAFTSYDLYKNDGSWDATAEFTWSSYIPFMPDIYWHSYHVRGSNGESQGYIITTPLTFKDAKFRLEDSEKHLLEEATLDLEDKELQLYSAAASTKGIATLKKSLNSKNQWSLSVSKPEEVDHRLIKFLSAIVIGQYFSFL